ncbi:PPC domain-containing DNA-binding protein [Enterovibrio coralii]|uniref:DNA-binding protein n=1 Tax=Enterovibrio coralii TaxID=294935 RepID=A0A135I5A6_9GAMM|nr:PPC domain-containing DNA-binding protein [Enterovibrio coralii]KXF80621.1 DNA-binding protein [Enterovibrio coralii]
MTLVTPLAFRLTRGADLKLSILSAVQNNQISAGCVASLVGCLSKLVIRLADGSSEKVFDEPLEILSLNGTLTPNHVHLHISVSDSEGRVWGGHLMEGSIVSHTAEVCLFSFPRMSFSRNFDASTGYTELVVSKLLNEQ